MIGYRHVFFNDCINMPSEYSHFSDIYDPYTSAPNYEYLFKGPSGLGPNPTVTDPRSIYGEIRDPGTTTVYETLPPPPKKFSIMSASENFSDGQDKGGYRVTPEVVIIVILAFMVWMLLSRTNKIIKVIKKMYKHRREGVVEGSSEEPGMFDDLF